MTFFRVDLLYELYMNGYNIIVGCINQSMCRTLLSFNPLDKILRKIYTALYGIYKEIMKVSVHFLIY